ncbi:hypothetical protein D039_5193B, partial [Vibrio parahaemolyticus EKP-028]
IPKVATELDTQIRTSTRCYPMRQF